MVCTEKQRDRSECELNVPKMRVLFKNGCSKGSLVGLQVGVCVHRGRFGCHTHIKVLFVCLFYWHQVAFCLPPFYTPSNPQSNTCT